MKHIIISSLPLFNISRLSLWWETTNQTAIFNSSVGSTSFILTSNNNQEQPLLTSTESDFHTCLGGYGQHDWQGDSKELPCITYSSSTSSLRIDADQHGLFPVWFEIIDGFQSNRTPSFIVTTDYAVGRLANFSSLSAVGAGSSLSINLQTMEIDDIIIPDISPLTEAVSSSYYAVVNAAFELATSVVSSSPSAGVTAEYDALSFSSKLLHCWLNNSQMFNVTFVPRVPLTIDYNLKVLFADHPTITAIIDFIPNDAHIPHLRNERPWQLFYEQYQFCSSSLRNNIAFSFSNYHEIDPLRVYFRSLLCSLLGTTVIYPYTGLPSDHKSLYLTRSDYNMLIELQYHAGHCTGDPYEARSFTIDQDGIYTAIGPDPIIIPQLPLSQETEDDKRKNYVQQIAMKHSTDTNITVLLLATYGYFDMLHNFLCYSHSLFTPAAGENVVSLPFIILTNDQRIEALAHSFGAGVIHSSMTLPSVAAADFGTVSYQLLMLSRTKMALDLLQVGFSPLIADIDTVWLRNPLVLNELQNKEQDVFIVNDGEGVCGCFVLLRPTANAIRFWSVVHSQHAQLIQEATVEQHQSENFGESEQRILTRLIYRPQYQDELKVYLLPGNYFPDGNQFFTKWPHTTLALEEVYVVHNNFIIGKETKQVRFQRYGLWQYYHPFDDIAHSSYGINYCREESSSHTFAASTKRINYIKTVNIAKPVHNTITKKNDLSICLTIEGLVDAETVDNFQVTMNSNPRIQEDSPSRSFGVFKGKIADKYPRSWSFTFAKPGTNLEAYVDVAWDQEHFAIDYRENVTILKKAHDEIREKYSHDHYWQEQSLDDEQCLQHLRYHIKVLTMTRAKSLHRLLTSLANANYHNRQDINLEIIIDGVRRPEGESALQAEVIQVANDFIWLHGNKTITIREKNFGLARQWFNAWVPTSNDELAFIFEDDLEVSSYYFTWASQAVERYYGCNNMQRQKQQELFVKLKKARDSNNSASSFDEIVHDYAGFPLMYGICLQRQYLTPNHYPFKMQLRNGHRPYLYSLIGSWGPLFFPFMWEAFRLWWEWNDGTAPLTSSLITNQFMQDNPGIWTPYLVRFAYEFGVKCLYANLPGNLTLVNNHREAGENYNQHMGPYARLLDGEILQYAVAKEGSVEEVKNFERRHQLDYHALQSAVNTWPTMAELSQWQIDFNLRQHGSYGKRSPFPLLVNNQYNAAVDWFEVEVREHYHLIASTHGVPKLTNMHWVEVVNMIVATLLPHEKVLCIEVNPLMKMLPTKLQASYFLSSYPHLCTAALASMECREMSTTIIDFFANHVGMLVLYPSVLSDKLIISVTAGSKPVQYLLVIDVCSSAPTIITLQFRYVATDTGVSSDGFEKYIMVEDVCDSHPVDHGAVLYRLQEDMYRIHGHNNVLVLDNDSIPFVAISKRLSESMTTRRMVDSKSNLFRY